MKTFEEFLDENRVQLAARLIEENNFPIVPFIEWYIVEGVHLSDNEFRQVMEGFWGDTWKGAAKGAGIGAGAGAGAGGVLGAGAGGLGAVPGAGIGAGIGGVLGGAVGGLYGAGKNIWNRLKGQQQNQPAPNQAADNVAMLTKMKTDYPQFSGVIDNMIKHLSGANQGGPDPATATNSQSDPNWYHSYGM